MTLRLTAILSAGLLISQVHAEKKDPSPAEKKDQPVTLKDQRAKVSYMIGFSLGTDLKSKSVEIKPELLATGVKDAMSGNKCALSKEEVSTTMSAFQQEMSARMAAKNSTKAPDAGAVEKNKKEGEAFLAENKKKKGVKTLPSGLQYMVVKPGSGASPRASDTVVTQYRGTLIDGTEFDSSYNSGPREFPITRVIAGWTEALQLMKVGSKWQIFVPPNLAYGEQGRGPIPPNATLTFEIELISIK